MVEQEAEIETISVGEQLKACRDKKQIGITEISSQLHLDTRIIRAIEEDDFDALPDPIYVRGYIRSYCKLLGVDADEYLDLFKKSVNREDPEIIPEIKYPSQTSSSDKPVKVVTYLITLGLVLLVIAWWQSNFIIKNQSFTATPATDASTTTPPEPQLEELPVDVFGGMSISPSDVPGDISIEPADVNLMTDVQPASEDAGLTGEGTGIDEGEPVENALPPVAEEPPAPVTAGDEPAAEQPAPEQAANYRSNQAISTGSTGPDELVLNITADSWIEIFDVNDQNIYFDLGRTGDTLTLYGTAPFDILLGFAQGVTIEFNGKPVDQAPYTRAGVARFTLGE